MSELKNMVIAVSGGVDSVVLLHMLANPDRRSETEASRSSTGFIPRSSISDLRSGLIVAHFDHGIRPNSDRDEVFVRELAKQYGLKYESKRIELGSEASEDRARKERYSFLRQVCKKHKALLVTAHHQDDVIETMIINLIRGTGWRGLAPMGRQIPDNNQKSKINNPNTLRPLLHTPKSEILDYARRHNLKWHEDSTNADQKYLRNYIRHHIVPMLYERSPDAKRQLLAINKEVEGIKDKVATELQKLIPYFTTIHDQRFTTYQLPRYHFIMWPRPVALEVMYTVLTQLDPDWHPSTLQLQRALHFIKSGQPAKQLELSKRLKLSLTVRSVQFKKS